MLLTEKVITKWHTSNKVLFIKKGYIFTKMKDEIEVKVEDLSDCSTTMVQVKCDCKDCKKPILSLTWVNYKRYVHDDGIYYCNKCSWKLTGIQNYKNTQLKNSKSFKQWCYDNLSKEETNKILLRWDYKLNYPNTPSSVTFSSAGIEKKGYWFKCEQGLHDSELQSIDKFIHGRNKLKCRKCNSFAQYLIDLYGCNALEIYWDYEKNILNPWAIDKGSNKHVWIKCIKNKRHDSHSSICNNFIYKCPDCNSLAQYIIDNYGENFLYKVWSDKNTKSPYEYTHNTKKRVFWKCEGGKHKDYLRRINSSVMYEFRCPKCVEERKESFLQEKTRLYLEQLGYKILHEYDCNIIIQNPKHKGKIGQMPFDNEVVDLKLIIEVHGQQHYCVTTWHKKLAKKHNTTPEYELHMQKVRDRYKKFISYIRGYSYLELSFTTEKNGSYKTIIDNKIKEILTNNIN